MVPLLTMELFNIVAKELLSKGRYTARDSQPRFSIFSDGDGEVEVQSFINGGWEKITVTEGSQVWVQVVEGVIILDLE